MPTLTRRNTVALIFVVLLVSQVGLMAFAQPKIVINHAWWGGNPSNFYDAAKKEFEAENPGVQVDLVSGYKDAMVVHCAAGTMDTMVMDSVFFGEFLQQGMLAPITPLLEADAQMRRDLEKDFWPGSYVWATYKGTLYALPYLWTQSQVLFYNKDRFAESGLPTPQFRTWEDMIQPLRALSAKEGQFGIQFHQIWSGIHELSLFNGGGFFDDPIYPTKANLNDPRTLKTAEFWVNLVTQDRVAGGSFADGTAAMNWTWWGNKGVWGPRPFAYDMVPTPAGPDAGSNVDYPAASANLSIASVSKNPEVSLKWIKFLLSPRMMKLATVDGAGVPTRRSVALEPEWLSADGMNNAVALAPLATAVPQNPFTPAWEEIRHLLEPEINAAFAGEKSIVSVLTSLNDQVDALVRKYPFK